MSAILMANSNVFLDAAAIFGYLGAALSSIFLIPQVYKVIKTKSIKDVSMIMTSIIILGTFIWLTYAILFMIGDPQANTVTMIPVLISNIAQLICSFVLLLLKLIYIGKININKNKEV